MKNVQREILNKFKILLNENKAYSIIIICSVITIFSVIIYNTVTTSNKGVIVNGINMSRISNKNRIGVYISGEVKNAGYIKIPKKQTLECAINKAGGITKNADVQRLDLKKKLRQGEKIIIPSKKDNEENIYIGEDKLEKVNINKASIKELVKLDGIGEKTAEKIVKYRDSNKFNQIEDIMSVPGIGSKKFQSIKANIEV